MAGRYQLRAVLAERGGVTTHEGVDPLTGLPVLAYRFSGTPAPGLRDLESENIPGLLHVDTSDAADDKTEVVVAYFKEYQPLEQPLSVSVSTLLADSARALKDAAQAGVVHGDLYPGRFLASRDHVLLEGFGVPWQARESAYRAPEAEASFAGDVFAWAKSVLELAKGRLDGATLSLLTSCLHADPAERPAASELYAALRLRRNLPEAVGSAGAVGETTIETTPAETTPAESAKALEVEDEGFQGTDLKNETYTPAAPAFDETELTFAPEDIPEEPFTEPPYDFSDGLGDGFDHGADHEASSASSPAAEALPVPPTTPPGTPPHSQNWDRHWDEDAEPELILSDPGDRYRVNKAASADGASTNPAAAATEPKPFVKDLPPGATYRPGEANTGLRPGVIQEYSFDAEPPADPRRRRLIIMLLLLIFGAAALAYLALFWQQRQDTVPALGAPTPATVYIVDATLAPPDLPPTDVYVVSSPAGSRNPPGALITVVSPPGRQIALDRSGTWQLQARFQKRASEIVTFQVPQERAISFTLPPEAADDPAQP